MIKQGRKKENEDKNIIEDEDKYKNKDSKNDNIIV